MQYTDRYRSPLGDILLAADELGLTGLWFEGQKYYACGLVDARQTGSVPALEAAVRWLDAYFGGQEPTVSVPLHFTGTPFQNEVWALLCTIPYGQTRSYGEIARQLAARRGMARLPARAVGSAVGRNRISLLVPCHRVVGTNGALTGYAGGLERKAALLALESAGQEPARTR